MVRNASAHLTDDGQLFLYAQTLTMAARTT